MTARECASLQLQELSALRAIFVLEGELHVDGRSLEQLEAIESGKTSGQGYEGLSVTIQMESPQGVEPTWLQFVLPSEYPLKQTPSHIALLSSSISDHQFEEAIGALKSLAESRVPSECVLDLVEAAKEWVEQLTHTKDEDQEQGPSSQTPVDGEEDDDELSAEQLLEIEREWIKYVESLPPQPCVLGRRVLYSHHIRSPIKRSLIVEWALELRLSGMCKIGYPGVIIVEGEEANCLEYLRRLQKLRWKHFVCRGEEIVQGKPYQTIDDLRALPRGFEELSSDGISEMAARCRAAGLEELFLRCMKIFSKKGGKKETNKSPRQRKGK